MIRDDTYLRKTALALLSMQRHSWEQGMAMQAFLELGDWELVTALAREAVSRSMPDGRVATIGVTDGNTDPCCAGEALEAAASRTGDPVLKEGAAALRCWALEKAPRNAEGCLYHLTTGKQFWADSLYMLPPYLACIGEYDAALKHWNTYWNALYDPASGLLAHIWDETEQRCTDPAHWGTGNGWALAGLARMIPLLPETYHPEKLQLIQKARRLLDRILAYGRADGSFGNVIDDPESFSEYNLTQMTAYTIYRGIADGWLGREYLPHAEQLRQAAHAHTDICGFVQPVCGAPTFDKPGVSPEAQAFALLLEAAARRCDENRK